MISVSKVLLVERFIDDEFVMISLDNPPKLNSDRMALERRVPMLKFIRIDVNNQNFQKFTASLAGREWRAQDTDYLSRHWRWSTARHLDAIHEKMGSVTSGFVVVEHDNILNELKLDQRKRLIFFEDDDAAMLALMKFG